MDILPIQSDFYLYTSPDGDVKLEVFIKDENIWLTQEKMWELFGVQKAAISKHLKNIFESNELDEKVVVSKMETTRRHWAISEKTQTKEVNFYNLDSIIAVGYRVNSLKATHFRVWSNKIIKNFIIKWFAMDDDRLKNGIFFGKDYFKELLERVRSIRSSERRIYLQITDIFAECAIDYDKNSEITKNFYANIQNKFHFAITGQTAAEIIYKNADSKKENMGLQVWKNSPNWRILKSDTTIAKNYLEEKEIKKLERTISSYFDYIENQIEQEKTFTMKILAESVDKFLTFNDFEVLSDKWKISRQMAENKASEEYEKFNKTQKINSDFETFLKSQK